MGAELSDTDFAHLRHCMVHDQLCARRLADERVLAAMEKVPRHLFVPERQQRSAYDDGPLPIGFGQTISQPYMVGRMTELLRLRPTDRVLEIGTGSGYQAAILAELAGNVWTVERHAGLAQRAAELLLELGYRNVRVITGDGSIGYPEAAPYDAIIVTAAAPAVPKCLRGQLAAYGRMVIPVTDRYNEDLRLIERTARPKAEPEAVPGREREDEDERRFTEVSVLACTFVPLIGKEGYPK